MDVIIPSALLTKEGDAALAARRRLAAEKKLTAFYDTEIGGNEYAYLRFTGEAAKTVSFGLSDFADGAFRGVDQLSLPSETFIEADDWNYDLYAFNGSPSVQMLLSQNIVSPDFTLGDVFSDVPMEEIETDLPRISREAVTDSGVRMDLAAHASGKAPAVLRILAAGDLVLTTVEGHLRTAVVKEPCVTSDEGILAFRPAGCLYRRIRETLFRWETGRTLSRNHESRDALVSHDIPTPPFARSAGRKGNHRSPHQTLR